MINTDPIWTHNREGYNVRVVATGDLKVKDDNDANWRDAVVYVRDDDDSDVPVKYIRSEEDFIAKFTEGA